MTRRIDRVHELRRRHEPVMTDRRAVDEASEQTLRDALGIPAGLELTFGRAAPAKPVEAGDAANDAANPGQEAEDRS